MHSSRMRTAHSLPYRERSVSGGSETPDRDPPWTKIPLYRDPIGQRPPDKDPPIQRPRWTETPLDRDLPVQRPPWTETPQKEHGIRERDHPCGQTNASENITFPQTSFESGKNYTFINSTIPSGKDVLLSLLRYSMMSLVCKPTDTAAYSE